MAKNWNLNLKPPKIDPKMVNCFKCNKEFGIKWAGPHKAYSRKNDWARWTGETEGDKKICDNCLIHLYKNEKQLYWEKVKDKKTRDILTDYITRGTIAAS